jgi:hypothetical protein
MIAFFLGLTLAIGALTASWLRRAPTPERKLRHVRGDPFHLANRLNYPDPGAADVRVVRTNYVPGSEPLQGNAVAEWTLGAAARPRRRRGVVRFGREGK